MSDGFSLDVGSALPFIYDELQSLLGRDEATKTARKELQIRLDTAARESALVQIIGMDRPIPIGDIYQPTRLLPRHASRTEEEDFWQLVRDNTDAIVFGLPGHGKTVLLHHVFTTLSSDESRKLLPVLYTLRRHGTVEELDRFILNLSAGKYKQVKKKTRVVLLVDGYDEISERRQASVLWSLRRFQSLGIGPFYLTSRLFYDVEDVKARHVQIAPFRPEDSRQYIETFARAYKAKINASKLLKELESHGFADFASHPLMLAMICILKTGPMPFLPRTTIGLIRRAIDTLTFRWDEAKNVFRSSRIPIDGEDRVRCMMRVAYAMTDLTATDSIVRKTTADYLRVAQHPDVSPQRLLMEMARWYGLLIPAYDDQWTFVHRTVHDYLAARHWVEMGKFNPTSVRVWNARAAYAACLTPDATTALTYALRNSDDIYAFAECLYNNANFYAGAVAEAVAEHFKRVSASFTTKQEDSRLYATTTKDFFEFTSEEFLRALLARGLITRSSVGDFLVVFSLDEMRRRNLDVPEGSYRRVLDRYKPEQAFVLESDQRRRRRFRLADLRVAT